MITDLLNLCKYYYFDKLSKNRCYTQHTAHTTRYNNKFNVNLPALNELCLSFKQNVYCTTLVSIKYLPYNAHLKPHFHLAIHTTEYILVYIYIAVEECMFFKISTFILYNK